MPRKKNLDTALMVRKANELIQNSRFSLTVQQQKIVLFFISQIKPGDDDFEVYKMSMVDFMRLCNLTDSGKNYENVKKSIDEIAAKHMWITTMDGGTARVQWIEQPYITPDGSELHILMNRFLKPYLLHLAQNYTEYELAYVLSFRSKYTIRLYELLQSVHFNKFNPHEHIFDIDDLRVRLDAENYAIYKDFRTRVIDPAVEEINKYSDKHIEFIPIKQGKAVKSLRFTISTKDAYDRIIALRDGERRKTKKETE